MNQSNETIDELLREYLAQQGQDWREDASNASPQYLRNLIRPMIRQNPPLRDALIALAEGCRGLKDWATLAAPKLTTDFSVSELQNLPATLARESARRWLIAAGSPPAKLSEEVLSRLVQMAIDAATPSHQHFPGRLRVHRRGGRIVAEVSGACGGEWGRE